ncbi:MAG: AarF/UbiB family protein [Ktedonobacteraceae bacterium]
MNALPTRNTRFLRKTSRLLQISRLVMRQYWAFRSFRKLTTEERKHHLDVPKQFTQSLLELGPLFVKLGQILSTRPDVLPEEYITELARLQEHVPPFSFVQVRMMIKEQFKQEIEELFRSFEEDPIAAASLAQVHLAVLNDGTQVAVKMQRPFAQERITADLALLSELIEIFRRLFPGKARRLNLVSGFNEFKRYTLQELDFSLEAKTLARFKHNFSAWPDIIIPQVYSDFVTPKVLTMQRVSGLRLHEITPTLSETQRKRLSHRLLEMEMKMFIADGFFHADLHPGNIFFTEDGNIVLLDFGMYGELSDEHRDHFILYWYAGLQRQLKRAFYHLIKQTTRLKHADEEAYYETFKELAELFYNSTIAERSLTQTYLAIIRNGAKFGFVFPSDLLLQAKALTTAEALAFTLTPNLKFEIEMPPIIANEFAQRATDFGRLSVLAERVLPELLLFGELPPASIREPSVRDVSFQPNWGDALTLLSEQVKAFQPNVANIRSLLDPSARKAFIHAYSDHEVDDLLESTWARYADLAPSVPSQETLGARFMVHLSTLTIAMYEALLSAGQSAEGATTLIYDMAWLVYTKMGAVQWTMAGAMSNDSLKKLRFATTAFRTFPFDSPSYLWKDVTVAPDVVAFDCLKCPVAEHFRTHNLSDLCVNTWCKLDYPLARQWGSELKRTGTIASGASICDFRWHAVKGRSVEE